MSVRSLPLVILCLLLFSGLAQASLETFVADVNAGYTGDIGQFRQQLLGRFPVNDVQLDMVVLSVDSPADAVICLWVAEQSRLRVDKVLQRYQQCRTLGWEAVLTALGFDRDSELSRSLQRGAFAWRRQVATLH